MDYRKLSNPAFFREAVLPMRLSNRWAGTSTAIAMTLLLASCAGQPPKEAVSQAELAVNKATESRAPQLAPLELRMARDHLDKANLEVQGKNYEEARRLAEKAIAEAQLAEAKSEAENTQQTLAELRESLDALREETSPK
jgi:hypothetical protein